MTDDLQIMFYTFVTLRSDRVRDAADGGTSSILSVKG